jgi:SAM-dependent methyltransferase
MTNNVSQVDIDHLAMIRANIESFMEDMGVRFARSGHLLLDIAPQDHKGAEPFLPEGVRYHTLDINPDSNATYVADLCKCAPLVGCNKYDLIVCTEVLEHTRQPFDAVTSIYDMLKPGGYVFVSTPFNFRVHGPLPDCWRFTEHGLRELFSSFEITELKALEAPNRFLMPIQYTLIAQKAV